MLLISFDKIGAEPIYQRFCADFAIMLLHEKYL